MGKLPFEGIRVADFGWILAAPLASQWLATLGADVIRIESKARPDLVRSGAVGGVIPGPDPSWNRVATFNSVNYSKRGCTLDMTKPKAQELAYRIIEKSDVVNEAFTTPVVERFGLTYDKLKSIKPDIILIANSSLGKTGPLGDVAGMGPANQAFAGLPSMTGYEGGTPTGMGGTWPDYTVGLTLAYLIISALYHRQRTGEGLYIDHSMAETVMSMIPGQLLDYSMNGRVAVPRGNRDDLAVPHNLYRCQGDDKWIAISVHDERQWAAFCKAAGHSEWLEDERFCDSFSRHLNVKELDALVTEWTLTLTNMEVMERLQAVGVPAGPSQNNEALINDPQLQFRNQFIETDHVEVGRRVSMGLQGQFSAIPERRYNAAPAMGQHNEEVFHDFLGLSREEIDRLVEEEVIY